MLSANIKMKIFALWMMILLPFFSSSQEKTLMLELSLEKASALAVEKNPLVLAGAIDRKIDKEIISQNKLKRIPQIYTDLNVQRNLIIPVTPVPANAFNGEHSGSDLIPIRFTTKWTANTGLNASFDLFNPQKRQAIQESKIRAEITRIENANDANEISFEASNAYISALIASEQLRLAVVDTVMKNDVLTISLQQFNEGRLLLSTLNQFRIDRNNGLNNYEQALRIYKDSKAELLNVIGYTSETTLEINFHDSLESLYYRYLNKVDTAQVGSLALSKLKENQGLLKVQINGAMNQYLPMITFRAYYGANYFDNNFDILKSSNWNGNSFINLGIRVPITEGLDRQKKINQLRLQKQADQLRYDQEKNKNRLAYLSATSEALSLEKIYSRTHESFSLAEKNLNLSQQQFAAGRLLVNEYYQANFNYQKEKNAYLNIAYSYILAKLKIEKLNKR